MPKIFHSKHFNDAVVKRNFYLNLFDGAIFSFALSFVSLQTVFPILIKKVSGSDFAIGLIPVVYTAGFNFPQIFVANYVRKLPYKKPWMLKTALGQRLPWLLIAVLVLFFIEDMNPKLALVFILASLGLAAVGGSINLPGWFDLFSKITPVQLRGRLFAFRSVVGAIMGVVGGAVVVLVLKSFSYPQNFGVLFLFAFIMMMISYAFLSSVREDKPNPSNQLLGNKEFYKKLFTIVRNEKNFRNFLVSDALMMLANMSQAFFAVYAVEKFNLPDSYAGTFTMTMMASMILGSLYFGYIADRFGHKINLIWASIFVGLSCIVAIVSPSVEFYYLVFVGASLNIILLQISRLTIISEICFEDDRPTYVALTNVITAPFVLSGMFGGIIVDAFGFNTLFAMSAIFSFATFLWLMIKVAEPRRILQPVQSH
ncbi:MAG: MFS transporter [Ignavibacteriaceae bacterium]